MKNLLILFLIGSIYNTTIAQNFYFGLKGGLNLATLSGDTSGLDSRSSVHFGVMSEFIITDEFSIQPELLYSGQGAKGDGEPIKIDYLNLPIMGKYYMTKGLSLEVGPQFGALLSARTDFDGRDENIIDEFRTINFGVNFGLGYKLPSGLNFGFRYYRGISNAYYTFYDYFDVYSDGLKIHNSVFQISVGYFF